MIKNTINLFIIASIIIFYFYVFKYYFSNQNIKNTNLNRQNIEQIVKDKTLDIPNLVNDTNNVIEFNTGFDEEIKNNKPRNFWDLLKSE